MADAFRGLTLKLGADARPVNSAIYEIMRAAGQAQTQLNKMNKALKFDRSNAAALGTAFNLASDKARLMAREVSTIKTALKQADSTMLKFSGRSGLGSQNLKKLAENTKEVYAANQRLRASYNNIDTQLATIYESAARVKMAEDGLSKTDAIKAVKDLAKGMDGVDEKARKARAEVERLVRIGAMGDSGLRESLGMGGMNNMTAGYRIAREVLHNLRAEQKDFQNDIEMMNQVEGYRNLKTQLVAAEAEMRQAASEATRLRTELFELGTDGRLMPAIENIKSLKSATEQATNEARQMKARYDAMPYSVEALRDKTLATKTAQATLQAQIDEVHAALKEIENDPAFDKQAASSEKAYVKASKIQREYTELSIAADKAEQNAEDLNKELDQMKSEGVANTSKKFRDVSDRMHAARREASELKARIDALDDDNATAALITQFRRLKTEAAGLKTEMMALKQVQGFTANMAAFGRNMRSGAYGLYTTLTPAITMAGRYAIQSAEDIDSSYRNMRKTVNGTEEEFEALKDAALDFSRTHFTSADQILEIESIGGQLGLAASNLGGFGEVVSNLDIATNIDAETLAENIGQLSNIMNDIDTSNAEQYQKDITSFSDALVRLGNNSAAQESNIMKVMMRIASIGNISGMTTPQLLAISTAVAATGQGAEAAGTAISRTFSNIEAAVGQGGDKLQAFADVAGMSAQEFADAWNNDPVTAFQNFINGLKRVNDEGGSVDQTLANLGINSVRQKQALMGLTNTTDVLADSLEMASTAWDGKSWISGDGSIEQAGDAAREAARKAEGFSGQLQMLKNNAQVLANEFTEGMAPILSVLNGLFQELTGSLEGMGSEGKTAMVVFAGILAALGPLGVGMSAILQSFDAGKRIINGARGGFIKFKVVLGDLSAGADLLGERFAASTGKMAGASRAAGRAMSGLSKALTFMSTGGGLAATIGIGIAVSLIAHAIADAQERADKLNKATTGMKDAMSEAAGVVSNASGSLESYGKDASAAAMSVDELLDSNSELVEKMRERNKTAQDEVNQLEAARKIIQRYSGQDLSGNVKAQGELVAAIDIVNDKLGTHYQVLDVATGKLADEAGQTENVTKAIYDNIAAREKQIETELYKQNYSDAVTAEKDAAAAWVEANEEYRTAAELANRYGGETLYNGKTLIEHERNVEDLRQAMADAGAATEMAAEALGTASAEAQGLDVSMRDLIKKSATPLWQGTADELDNFATAVEEAGLSMTSVSEMSSSEWAELINAYISGEAEITEVMSNLGLGVETLAERYKNALVNIDGNFDTLVWAANYAGMNVDQFTQALNEAGITAQMFANLSAESFQIMYDNASGSLTGVLDQIALLNAAGLDPKQIVVDGSGAQIALETFDAEARSLTFNGIEYTITANGEIATQQISEAQAAANQYDQTSASASIGEEGAEESGAAIGEASEEGEHYDGSTYTATADLDTSPADTSLNNLIGRLTAFANTTYTAGVSTSENASGGIAARSIRAIPLNASGGINGIVTGPMLTNVGWVGEAGDEAVFHMRNAGGAIVPLSNRAHVRPFAQAVASEMAYFQPNMQAGKTVNIYVDGDVLRMSKVAQAELDSFIDSMERLVVQNGGR